MSEAARHGTRTGENKIRDLLVSLGAKTEVGEEGKMPDSKKFIVLIGSLHALMIVFFAIGTE